MLLEYKFLKKGGQGVARGEGLGFTLYPGLVPDTLRTALRLGCIALVVVGPGFEGYGVCSGPLLFGAGELRPPVPVSLMSFS